MEESILESIKKLLGAENLEEFDDNIRIFINGGLNILTENGVGDPKGFRITENNETWSDFITNDNPILYELCKDYIFLRTKILFDSEQIKGGTLTAYKEQMNEVLWRICQQADPADFFETHKED